MRNDGLPGITWDYCELLGITRNEELHRDYEECMITWDHLRLLRVAMDYEELMITHGLRGMKDYPGSLWIAASYEGLRGMIDYLGITRNE